MSTNDDQDDVVLAQGDLSCSSSASQDEDDDEDDVVYEEEDDDEDDVIDSASIPLPVAVSTAPPAVTVALHARPPTPTPTTISEAVDPKRPRTANYEVVILPSPEEKKPPLPAATAAIDDSRRLFQRLWTDEDEIELLQGFLDYTNQRGGASRGGGGGGSHQNDTALFYDQIKSKLQLEFNKNQLVEKLRRLKKKYRNLLNKLAAGKEVTFKSPHDQATFEISKKIWSNFGAATAVASSAVDDNALDDEDSNPNNLNSHNFNLNHYEIKSEESPPGYLKSTPQRPRKRQQLKTPSFVDPSAPRMIKENHHNMSNGVVAAVGGSGSDCRNCNVQGMIEETVKSCVSPLFRDLSNAMAGGGGQSRGFGGLSLNPIPLSFGGPSINLNFGSKEVAEEPWRKQQILELEVYSKRLELVQNQIKVALDELRSIGER